MTQALARVGDAVEGTCRAHKSPRHFSGTITQGSATCTADGLGLARVGDTGTTDCGHTFVITQGSSVSTADGVGLARTGDAVQVVQGGEGVITGGSSVCTTA